VLVRGKLCRPRGVRIAMPGTGRSRAAEGASGRTGVVAETNVPSNISLFGGTITAWSA
jgi:hypothetical protein